MSTPTQIRIGVGGWTFEPWRGVFYPAALKQKDELGYMSRQLRAITFSGLLILSSAITGDTNDSFTIA